MLGFAQSLLLGLRDLCKEVVMFFWNVLRRMWNKG